MKALANKTTDVDAQIKAAAQVQLAKEELKKAMQCQLNDYHTTTFKGLEKNFKAAYRGQRWLPQSASVSIPIRVPFTPLIASSLPLNYMH